MKGTERIPIHGGTNPEGAFNIVGYNGDSGTLLATMPRGQVISAGSGLTADGYPISVGSSFMIALEYTPDGPHAEAVVSYSESSDPASPHYADQTHLFSESKYRAVLFTEDEIKNDPKLEVVDLSIE
jgi:acyl-homoserine-lactone acylase